MRKSILKKLAVLSVMIVTSALFCGYTSVKGTGHPDEWDIDNTQFVYDYADVFTDDEELTLQEMCDDIGNELELDIMIVSATDLGGMHESQYAERFYLAGGYDDGILYLIDLEHDGIYVIRSGLAEVFIDDYDSEYILDEIWKQYEDYDYYESAEVFVEVVDDLVGTKKNDSQFEELEDAWNDGGYVYYDDFWAVYGDDISEAYDESIFTSFKNPLVSMAVAAVIALIAVLIMCISTNAKMTVDSNTYMKRSSFLLRHRFDRFMHTTTRSYRVSSSSGGSGGGSRGHSSSHRSGGRSFSGGGRRR